MANENRESNNDIPLNELDGVTEEHLNISNERTETAWAVKSILEKKEILTIAYLTSFKLNKKEEIEAVEGIETLKDLQNHMMKEIEFMELGMGESFVKGDFRSNLELEIKNDILSILPKGEYNGEDLSEIKFSPEDYKE